MSFYSAQTRCKCGSSLRKTTPSSCYGSGAFCDGCRRSISKWSTVYHCPNDKSYQHSGGYDLCPSCYNRNGSGSSSADTMTNAILGQMSLDKSLQKKAFDEEIKYKKLNEQQIEEYNALKKKYSEKEEKIWNNNKRLKVKIYESRDVIERYERKVNKAKQTLSKKRIETAAAKSQRSEIQRKYTTLQETIVQFKEEIERLKKDGLAVRDENSSLKQTVNKILDDKKEQEMKILNLEKELQRFESQRGMHLDESQFMEWNHKQVSMWIQSLQNGYFRKYMDVVSVQLKECEMCGKDLEHLTSTDIRGFGIKTFSDAKKLEISVRALVSGQKTNKEPRIAKQENEGVFATNYI